MAEQSQEEMLAEQKKNCIFCKIIAGEITCKKVYEDDKFIAFLDINPAIPGHTILLPKEHIPILAIMPEDMQRNLFELTSKLSKAIQDAMIAQRITVVSQSGYAAGQRPPFHVMVHILPREKGDALEKFDLEKQDIVQSDMLPLVSTFADATKQVLRHVGREDLLKTPEQKSAETNLADVKSSEDKTSKEESSAGFEEKPNVKDSIHDAASINQDDDSSNESSEESKTMEFNSTSEALEEVLAMSPDLRNFIIHQPGLVQDYIEKSPKLKKLFEGVDINALSAALRAQESSMVQEKSTRLQKKDMKDVAAKDMPIEDLFKFIDGNEGLRTWLLEHPQELSENIEKNPKLQVFFDGVDIMDLAKRYRGYLLKRGGA